MTLSVQTLRYTYNAPVQSGVYPYPAAYWGKAHLRAWFILDLGGGETGVTGDLTLDTDYTVSPAGLSYAGGNLTLLATPPANATDLVIARSTVPAQESALKAAELVFEQALDRLTMVAQDHRGALDDINLTEDQLAAAIAAAAQAEQAAAGRFNTRAAVASAIVSGTVGAVVTQGYATIGDGGGALYKRVGAEPAHGLKVQSADGAWWELVTGPGGSVDVRQAGAVGDGVTDDTAAFNAAIGGLPAGGGVLDLSPGNYVVTIASLTPGARGIIWTGPGLINGSLDADLPGYRQTPADVGTPFVIAIAGQSNAAGAETGGPNPASPWVKVWDAGLGTPAWGSSDYTQNPLLRTQPNGNGGNNNIGLAFAHRVRKETGRPVYMVFDANGGASIDDWVATGTSSARYAALKTKVEAALASSDLAGVSKLDAILWVQGEADAGDTLAVHLANLQTLVAQFRAETWFDDQTPILMGGLSNLHERSEPVKAIRELSRVDQFVTYVSSRGLMTDEGGADFTHFLGAELYEFGYHGFWNAYRQTPATVQIPQFPFRNRIGEEVTIADDTVIFPAGAALWLGGAAGPNTAPGSIASGPGVDTNANYSIAFGQTISINGGALAAAAFGLEVTVDGTGDYSLNGGRGYTQQTPYGHVCGTFPLSPVLDYHLVVGCGTSTGNRKNGLAVHKDGRVEAANLATPRGGDLTIAAGVITVTGSYHAVDTQSAASTDDLDTINGGTTGARLVLRAANSARTVVVKDGTGNLRLAGDFSLDNAEDTIELIFDAVLATWQEIGRSDNGA